MRLINLILLIGGYGAGQGSIFLAQTWLITEGYIGLVADFGVTFYTATLCIILVDFGSTAVLARETAAAQNRFAFGQQPTRSIWANFWSITPSRAVTAITIAIIGGVVASASESPFTRAYATWAWPAFVAWAFNSTGILDGLRLTGVNGVAGSLPFAISGATLALVAGSPPEVAGAALGAALSSGYIMTTAAQFIALQYSGHGPQWTRPTCSNIVKTSLSGVAALLSTLPGQLYFRFQLFLCHIFLGEAGVALLLYAKQIVIGAAQLIGFLRRIEFPALVSRLDRPHGPILSEVFATQRLGTRVAAASSISVLTCGVIVSLMMTGAAAKAGGAAALFAPVILTSALQLSLTQALTAQGRYRATAIILLVTTALGAAINTALIFNFRLYSFLAADIACNATAIYFSARLLLKHQRSTVQGRHS